VAALHVQPAAHDVGGAEVELLPPLELQPPQELLTPLERASSETDGIFVSTLVLFFEPFGLPRLRLGGGTVSGQSSISFS